MIGLGVRYGAGRHKLDIGPIETIYGLKVGGITVRHHALLLANAIASGTGF